MHACIASLPGLRSGPVCMYPRHNACCILLRCPKISVQSIVRHIGSHRFSKPTRGIYIPRTIFSDGGAASGAESRGGGEVGLIGYDSTEALS